MKRKITPIQLLQLVMMAGLGMALAAGAAIRSGNDGGRTIDTAYVALATIPGGCQGGNPNGVCSSVERCSATIYDANGTPQNIGCSDCGSCCGNGTCGSPWSASVPYTENCTTCTADCGGCPGFCGDGSCDTADGETPCSCTADCGPCCGDGTCDSADGETVNTCATDCGSCNNDGVCAGGALGENCDTCPNDCGGNGGNCCGDGACTGNESATDCPADCTSNSGNGNSGSGGGGCGTTIPPANDPDYGVQSGCDLSADEEQALYDLVEDLLEGAKNDSRRILVNSANIDTGVILTASQCCTDSGTPYTASGTSYTVPSFQDCDTSCISAVTKIYYGEDPNDAIHANGLDGAGILAIEGTLQVNGGCWWYGIIVCRGDMTFAGGGNNSTNIQGAVLTQETATFGGSFTLTLDYCAIQMATDPGTTVPTGELVAWRDIS